MPTVAHHAPGTARVVPIIKAEPPKNQVAKIVAFYLPQFHPIKQNDEWWGKGFTEWSNVTRAVPQFVDHYQPRLPGELGFYDLRIPEVQTRQAELARLYGISAFCLYVYYFQGEVLLELPLDNILKNKDFHQEFCLCWANENWTRRWDGLDAEILIDQKYSPDNDVGFISHVSKYLRDDNLRIDGRPVLLVYRAQDIPSMRDTAKRWRDWCSLNGIGDIYLVVTHSFGIIDPREYGCDAAVEFPPVGANLTEVTADQVLINEGYTGHIYDWRGLTSAAKPSFDYRVFRTVCPSWDNEPRRPGRGTVLVNHTPAAYCAWLQRELVRTVEQVPAVEERLVFVNAWNEWAEGAYLEPDRRYGYAYLEANRMALTRAALRLNDRRKDVRTPRTAIVVHAYYLDVFSEIVGVLEAIEATTDIFVSTTPEQVASVTTILKAANLPGQVRSYPNKGRDILPFILTLREIEIDRYDFVLKLHTKRSTHRGDGNDWRREACSGLAGVEQRRWIEAELQQNRDIGIVAAESQVVSMSTFLGSNAENVKWLAGRLGFEDLDPAKEAFVAGSMFFARADALRPLLNLALDAEDFEAEQAQLDGTMAHAVERAIGYSCQAAGLRLASIETKPKGGIGLTTEINLECKYAEPTIQH